ncbi:hypothetical protein BDK51DRAFT_34372, partial [Blyttiomyces helicus]
MEFIKNYQTPRKSLKNNEDQTENFNIGYKVNEYLHHKIVRPYYDWDESGFDLEPSEERKEESLSRFKEAISKLHPDAEIIYARRSGLKITRHKKTNVLTEKYKPKELDDAVYDDDQCLGVVHAHRTDDDKRFLKPIQPGLERSAFLAQYMFGDEKELVVEKGCDDNIQQNKRKPPSQKTEKVRVNKKFKGKIQTSDNNLEEHDCQKDDIDESQLENDKAVTINEENSLVLEDFVKKEYSNGEILQIL